MEYVFKSVAAVFGAVVSFAFGGWDLALQTLFIFVVLDYITGILASAKEGKLSSSAGMYGISKKMMIFVLVSLGHSLDLYLGGGNSMFRDGTIAFFVANEFISILENSGRMGIPIPSPLEKAVDLLKNKKEDDKK